MGNLVCSGAVCQCSFGAAPATLEVLSTANMNISGLPVATIMDYKSMVNIKSFGMCSCPSNPAVASATTAALGVPTPAPCVPVFAAPWAPGSPKVFIGNVPALNNSSKLNCTYGGVISIVNPGENSVQSP